MGWEYQYWQEELTFHQVARSTTTEISWSSYTAHANLRAAIQTGYSITASTMDAINYLASTFTYHQHSMYDLHNVTTGGYDSVPTTTYDHWENSGYPYNGSGYMYSFNIGNPCAQGAPITTASVNELRARIYQIREHHFHYWYDDSY